MIKRLLLLILLAALSFGPPAYAQDGEDEPLLFLVSSLAPNMNRVYIGWVNISENSYRPVTEFNAVSVCPPRVTNEGTHLIYEPVAPPKQSFTFNVSLSSGGLLPLDPEFEIPLGCPAINPAKGSIAWLSQGEEDQTQVVVTNQDGSNAVVLATHSSAYNPLWSPDGSILIYTAVDGDPTFRALISHQEASTSFWRRDAGLVTDYLWHPNGEQLIVTYYTQTEAVIGTLPRDCVLQTECQPMPLATFELEASLILTNAFSPDENALLILREKPGEENNIQSSLFRVNLSEGGAERLTDSPNLTKTSAAWVEDTIYFVGSRFDPATFSLLESAIYQMPTGSEEVSLAYSQPDFFPGQILWTSR